MRHEIGIDMGPTSSSLKRRLRQARLLFYLTTRFRNGPELASNLARKRPSGRAVCWDGMVYQHPADKMGLAEAILEIWHDQVYTGAFYHPAASDVIIDAGANVGVFSVWLARQYRNTRVLAFEPNDENHRCLTENLSAGGVSNLKVYRAGLGGVAGVGVMAGDKDRSLDQTVSFVTPDAASFSQADQFPLYSFTDAIDMAAADRINLFKVDIEGSERELFEHARAEDIDRVDRFAIEYHDSIKPGTSELLQARLAATHHVELHPSVRAGCGMLYARSRHAR